jgi:signal peptidase I
MKRWLQIRRMRKIARQVLHEARHLRHMREDVAAPDAIAALHQAETQLRTARRAGDVGAMERGAEAVAAAMDVVAPVREHARIRENVEILVVAVVVAMAFRTFFIQPFKIPTGSMQPTLYGVNAGEQQGRKWHDHFPLNLPRLIVFGERYQEVRAKVDGLVEMRVDESEEWFRFYVAGVPHDIPRAMPRHVQPGFSRVTKGQLLASGRMRFGDHIFVNKVRYNFTRPERGDIFVFSTDGIRYDRIRPDSFYIKRIAGLPGERIQIDPPYLVADGERVERPYAFQRLVAGTREGYNGYQLPMADRLTPMKLGRPGQVLELSGTEYLPLGDNTLSSLDGRYFGGVDRRNIVGPAFMVYWPISPRWGFVE